MNKLPLVTVLIPTYERPEYLAVAIESVLMQTYKNIEIFISDNSRDKRTYQMMQNYINKHRNIIYEYHPEYDFWGNWNRLQEYNNSQTKYISYLMDDDVYLPNRIEIMVKYSLKHPKASIITSHRLLIDSDGELLPENSINQKLCEKVTEINGRQAGRNLLFYINNFIGEPTTVLIRKDKFGDCRLGWTGKEGEFLVTDYPAWLKLLEKGNLLYIPESLSCFRQHKEQDSYSNRFLVNVPVCYAMEIKHAWDNKIFIINEQDMNQCVVNLLSTTLNIISKMDRLGISFHDNRRIIMYRLMDAAIRSLNSGYNIDLSWIEK